MAIGIIIGGAFTPIVTAISDVLLSIIAGLVGSPEFDSVLMFTINGFRGQARCHSHRAGRFLLVAAALYFFVVLPMNKFNDVFIAMTAGREEAADANTELLTEIRDLATNSELELRFPLAGCDLTVHEQLDQAVHGTKS